MPNVWAYKKEPDIGFTQDTNFGYQITFQFDDTADLLGQLTQRKLNGKIDKLAIVAHGDGGGRVMLEQGNDLTFANIDRFRESFHRLRWFVKRDAHVIFAACIAGQGPDGTQLLRAVSRLLPGRQVVGFTQFGGLIASGFNAPGAVYSRGAPYEGGALRTRGELLDEYSQFAKIAQNGEIIAWPWEESVGRYYRIGWPPAR